MEWIKKLGKGELNMILILGSWAYIHNFYLRESIRQILVWWWKHWKMKQNTVNLIYSYLLVINLFFILFIICFSFIICAVLRGWVSLCLLYSCLILWATCYLMYSCSVFGSWEIAVSVSNAKVAIQFLCLCPKLYLRPLLRSDSSSLVKVMFVLLTARGYNCLWKSELLVWLFDSWFNFALIVLYFLSASRLTKKRMDSIVVRHMLPHSWAAFRWALYKSLLSFCFFLCRNLISSL